MSLFSRPNLIPSFHFVTPDGGRSAADPGFFKGSVGTGEGLKVEWLHQNQPIIWPKIPPKLHDNERNLTTGGCSPFGSASEDGEAVYQNKWYIFSEGTDASLLALWCLHNILKWYALWKYPLGYLWSYCWSQRRICHLKVIHIVKNVTKTYSDTKIRSCHKGVGIFCRIVLLFSVHYLFLFFFHWNETIYFTNLLFALTLPNFHINTNL